MSSIRSPAPSTPGNSNQGRDDAPPRSRWRRRLLIGVVVFAVLGGVGALVNPENDSTSGVSAEFEVPRVEVLGAVEYDDPNSPVVAEIFPGVNPAGLERVAVLDEHRVRGYRGDGSWVEVATDPERPRLQLLGSDGTAVIAELPADTPVAELEGEATARVTAVDPSGAVASELVTVPLTASGEQSSAPMVDAEPIAHARSAVGSGSGGRTVSVTIASTMATVPVALAGIGRDERDLVQVYGECAAEPASVDCSVGVDGSNLVVTHNIRAEVNTEILRTVRGGELELAEQLEECEGIGPVLVVLGAGVAVAVAGSVLAIGGLLGFLLTALAESTVVAALAQTGAALVTLAGITISLTAVPASAAFHPCGRWKSRPDVVQEYLERIAAARVTVSPDAIPLSDQLPPIVTVSPPTVGPYAPFDPSDPESFSPNRPGVVVSQPVLITFSDRAPDGPVEPPPDDPVTPRPPADSVPTLVSPTEGARFVRPSSGANDVEVSVRGFPANTDLEVTILDPSGRPLTLPIVFPQTLRTDARGTATESYGVVATVNPTGTYTVRVAGGGVAVSTTFVVVG